MPFEITMPQLGLTMETGSVVEWLVKEGDRFNRGQEIIEVETDKATVAVEAHQEGVLARILVPEGQEVPVGMVIAVAVAPGETLPADWKATQPPVVTAHPLTPAEEVQVTSVAANLAAELGLDLSLVSGSGPQGKITRSDVLEAAAAIIQAQTLARPEPPPGPPHVTATTPLKGVRKIVSEGMATSAQATARVTLFREVGVTHLVKLREQLKAQGERVSYDDILIRICAVALQEHPEANARLGKGRIEYLDQVNIGLAVDTDHGLLVPVVQDADTLSIPQIAAETTRLVEAARSGRSLPDDLTGGTFTITNLGIFGVEGFTPIINLPECCILGVGRIVRRPIVDDTDDTVMVRPMMTLSLAFDHRVIDGAPAARFLDRIAQMTGDPKLLPTLNE